MQEVWKNMIGYEDLYLISNMGRIKSLEKIIHYPNSCYNKTNKGVVRKERFLKPSLKKRYLSVTLSKNNVKKYELVHRLVAIHFVDNPNNLPCVNHIDGDKHNNFVSNLEWCTHSENSKHAIEIGLVNIKTGSEHHAFKHGKYSKNYSPLQDL
jgi:hypothetical protein